MTHRPADMALRGRNLVPLDQGNRVAVDNADTVGLLHINQKGFEFLCELGVFARYLFLYCMELDSKIDNLLSI